MQLTIDLLCPRSQWEWQGNDPETAREELSAHFKTCAAGVVLNIEMAMVTDVAAAITLIGELPK